MSLPDPKPALLIRYSYLWWDEANAGQEAGRKDRPAVVILVTFDADGKKIILVAPVTHSEPRAPEHGVEIPHATKKRLGLDSERSWIVTTEVNRFEWPGPDIRTTGPGGSDSFAYGFIPSTLFDAVIRQIRANSKLVAGQIVARTK